MEKKNVLLIGGAVVLALILIVTATVVAYLQNAGQIPSVNQPKDPSKVIRSPQITGEYSYEDIDGELRKNKKLIEDFYCDGYPLARSGDTFYLSVADADIGQLRGFEFSATVTDKTRDCYIVFQEEIDNTSWFAPGNNKSYAIRVYTDVEYQDAVLVTTSMPFLTIETKNNKSVSGSDVACSILLRDGNWRNHGTALITTSEATIRTRGASSSGFSKKAYRLNLKESNGTDPRQTSLLGLRSDDDWVLDAMYIDPTRMHNRLCNEIWSELSEGKYPLTSNPASEGEYVEVILNGTYVGLYYLIEPVDQKQLGLDEENGVLIKAVSWIGTYFDKYDNNINGATWMGFEMKHPDPTTGVSPVKWRTFFMLLKATVESEEDPETFVEIAEQRLDVDNITDYWLFLTAFSLRDNRGKNLYWSIEDTNDANAKYYITPWDCDLCMGYRYGGSPIPRFRDKYENDYIDDFILLKKYLEADIENSREILCRKWEEYTAEGGVLNLEKILGRAEELYKYLEDTGAWARETKKWKESMPEDPDEEFEYMREWLTGRYTEFMPERMKQFENEAE